MQIDEIPQNSTDETRWDVLDRITPKNSTCFAFAATRLLLSAWRDIGVDSVFQIMRDRYSKDRPASGALEIVVADFLQNRRAASLEDDTLFESDFLDRVQGPFGLTRAVPNVLTILRLLARVVKIVWYFDIIGHSFHATDFFTPRLQLVLGNLERPDSEAYLIQSLSDMLTRWAAQSSAS